MRIVFEYTHLYIRMQTNIHKNEKPYLFAAIEVEEITSNQQRWVRWVLKCLHFTFWAHDYLCRWAHDYLYRLIPVEFGDRSCPYKVKWRSGFQIVRYHSTNISIRIRDPIVVNTFVFTTYCIRESPSYMNIRRHGVYKPAGRLGVFLDTQTLQKQPSGHKNFSSSYNSPDLV